MFDVTGSSIHPSVNEPSPHTVEQWWERLLQAAQSKRTELTRTRRLTHEDVEALASQVFEEVAHQALNADGVRLPSQWRLRLIGEMSGLGPLLGLVADPSVEDITVNYGHIWVYRTSKGWEYEGYHGDQIGEALRVLMDRAGARPPTPAIPIADAVIQQSVPTDEGVIRKALRINYIMPPASLYGDAVTIRVINYSRAVDLATLTTSRLPPPPHHSFQPRQFNDTGMLSSAAANYLLSVLVHGGVVLVAGTTGSGKTTLARALLQAMLDEYPRGALRLFIIEDANEIILNDWNGDPSNDTGNVVYTQTRPESPEGPRAITAYDLIRAALRARPHGIVVGEARGAEAWELVRAAATGHGHSSFTIHATSAQGVWPRFAQAVQAHPEVRQLPDWAVAQGFAEAVSAIAYVERHPVHGQRVREVAEVSRVVERAAGRPTISPLFKWDDTQNKLVPTGNRPSREGFTANDLNLPGEFFATTTFGGGW